jgi:hypothetical protein
MANFSELREGEVRRIHLLRGWMNNQREAYFSDDAPSFGRWHHPSA